MNATLSTAIHDLPRRAACSAAAALLCAATLTTALLPSITVAAVAPARRIVDLPRRLIKGSVSRTPLAAVDLPQVAVAGSHSA